MKNPNLTETVDFSVREDHLASPIRLVEDFATHLRLHEKEELRELDKHLDFVITVIEGWTRRISEAKKPKPEYRDYGRDVSEGWPVNE